MTKIFRYERKENTLLTKDKIIAMKKKNNRITLIVSKKN